VNRSADKHQPLLERGPRRDEQAARRPRADVVITM